MKQAIHIFQKDVLYVRKELCLLFAFVVLYAWAATHTSFPIWAELLLDIAAVYLIARLIHAEAIPGDRQFWITRPYHRGSLLSAKLLGIVLLVNAPIFAARLYVLLHDGFPLATILWPLFWSHCMLFFGGMLPVAAFASITRGAVPFTFATLGFVAVTLAANASIIPPLAPAVRFTLSGSQWVWHSIAAITLVAFAVPVLYLQYRTRRTWASRLVIALIGVIGIATYLYFPWTTAAAIQTATSPRHFDPDNLQVTLAPAAKRLYSRGMMGRQGFQVDVPLHIAGVPKDVELIPDGVTLAFKAQDGTTWSSGHYIYPAVGRDLPGFGPTTLNVNVDVPTEFFERAKNQPVTVTAELYVSLFGNPKSETIPVQSEPVNTLEGLQCRTGAFRQLVCLAPFGWPSRLIYAKFPTGGILAFTRFVSYSPFPAGIHFDEVSSRAVSYPQGVREVTIVSNQLLGSVRREFVAEQFPLVELSIPIQGTSRKE